MINRKGVIIMTVFSFIYAVLELGMQWDPSKVVSSPAWMKSIFTPAISLYFYRVIYILIFGFPSYLASGKLLSIETVWYLIYGSVVEDVMYWIIDLKLPFSWAWFYPVYVDIPIDDVIGVIILVAIYEFVKQKSNARMN
ncbi:hypothetical protein GFS03_13160 [Sulfolobus sp. E5-1-F]|uniref:hypothetical protein n=1 Tax=Sulfolobaceae TaxID=118883 RepID=UPI001296B09D|nr:MULTISPECIES: hypothetical protein [unclassified Sulfolobus]QGA55447.1 hypothetical protein GFS03_13160 [Sulfolobus sp. E5-1-F]QGA68208.1 hypothetical protein GFS33_05050 [Sulfolobus sp. E11-6]